MTEREALNVDGSPVPKATTALFTAVTQIVVFGPHLGHEGRYSHYVHEAVPGALSYLNQHFTSLWEKSTMFRRGFWASAKKSAPSTFKIEPDQEISGRETQEIKLLVDRRSIVVARFVAQPMAGLILFKRLRSVKSPMP